MKKYFISFIIIAALAAGLLLTGGQTIQSKYDKSVLSAVENTNVEKVSVTASALNVRSGKGTKFPIVDVVYRGEILDVMGQLGNWYIIHTNDDIVGTVYKYYTKPVSNSTPRQPAPKPDPAPAPQPEPTSTPEPKPASNPSSNLSYEQSRMFELVNQERGKAGVKPLVWDTELARIAYFKAKDMVDNNYFSHTSPTYGSPFEMMKDFGISYRTAGENLAGYNDVEKAHYGLMNSDGHRKNILNPNFTHIGIGVEKSPKYGYVFVQMFIGK